MKNKKKIKVLESKLEWANNVAINADLSQISASLNDSLIKK
jgi:hypothetical protein